jgi:lipoprotein-anchoring transpeptidase ErfK/SrfK
VKRGEFLASIAYQHGVSVQAVLAANRLPNPNILFIGQHLNIPSGAAAAPRPVPAVSSLEHPASSAANVPATGKWIDVNVTAQTLSAYEGDQLVFSTKVSTGLPRTPTVLGRFRIRTKLRAQTMAGPGYYLPNVPYVMYFYRGYAIHGTYWHNNFGRPMSRGCINMRTSEAQWLYNWASVGTLVVTHR